jgi:hypothetical protein
VLGELVATKDAESWRAYMYLAVRYRTRAWPGSDGDALAAAHRAHGRARTVPWTPAGKHARMHARAAWLPALRRGAHRARVEAEAQNATRPPATPTPTPGLDPLDLPDDVAFDARYKACSRECVFRVRGAYRCALCSSPAHAPN